MPRTIAVRGTLAMLAVLAMVTGCTAQAADRPDGRDDSRPGGSSAVSSPAPAPAASPTPEPADEPGREPGHEPKAAPEPKKPPESSAPPADVLMSQGSQGAKVRELQARLAQIGWFDDTPTGFYGQVTVAAVRGFQGKRGLPATGKTDTVTWRRLLAMTTEPTAGELNGEAVRKPAVKLDARCLTGRVMCVSKTTRTLSWVVDGTVRATMDVRFGSEYTPTREGSFSVFLTSRHHVSTLYDTPMPYAMFFSGGQAVHYSSDFAARGYNGASHGCVNVRDRAAIAALFAEVRKGDKVVVHW
ncbi:L,D-transpeptidase family protein [Streptomyces katsurahamanus]|uniref:Murein L,D-transpeptidase n=1 Tax=Streptomyces katsurahamanus TaxID=2577098 RepID=A0ABW9NVR8_9ACTN|nr:L,D-transpeptidase family protein [Streptomyces katsurahamanus]MQS37400.1 murein L,D-transpeptidase [Streptomyces katsurahamanus]